MLRCFFAALNSCNVALQEAAIKRKGRTPVACALAEEVPEWRASRRLGVPAEGVPAPLRVIEAYRRHRSDMTAIGQARFIEGQLATPARERATHGTCPAPRFPIS